MPDITMCENEYCSLKIKCKRHGASGTKPSEYQSFWWFIQGDNGKCDYFLEKKDV